MDRRNLRLSILVLVLVAANLWVFFGQSANDNLSFDPMSYQVSDTSKVASFRLTKGEESVKLSRQEKWMVNDQYQADAGFVRIFMNVVGQVELVRELTGQKQQQVLQKADEAIKVDIQGEKQLTYFVLGNPGKTETYFLSEDLQNAYLAEIPGYSDYIGSIFQLTTQQWRDRVIINGNWRSIQKLTVNYSSNQMTDLSIQFKGDFYEVEGLTRIDSNAVVNYLNSFENLTANERISMGQLPEMDSLLQHEAMATITLQDIYFKEPKKITFYPELQGIRVQLVTDPNGEPVLFDKNRVRDLLPNLSDFSYQNQ